MAYEAERALRHVEPGAVEERVVHATAASVAAPSEILVDVFQVSALKLDPAPAVPQRSAAPPAPSPGRPSPPQPAPPLQEPTGTAVRKALLDEVKAWRDEPAPKAVPCQPRVSEAAVASLPAATVYKPVLGSTKKRREQCRAELSADDAAGAHADHEALASRLQMRKPKKNLVDEACTLSVPSQRHHRTFGRVVETKA